MLVTTMSMETVKTNAGHQMSMETVKTNAGHLNVNENSKDKCWSPQCQWKQ